ncbi:MAG: hypothetical protein LUQ20_05990 [Candidatus Methanoperedens sp.]|nr:hypothetical protein [Candidatus Methanoperedens sp.]
MMRVKFIHTHVNMCNGRKNMNANNNVKKEIVFTKAGVIVPVRVDNPLQGVTWEQKLIQYTDIKKIGILTLRVECIQPEIKDDILIALKMQGEFERKPDKQVDDINSFARKNEMYGEILPSLLKMDLSNKFPKYLLTPDGQKSNATSWANLLVEIANYLESINKINDGNIPILDSAKRTRYLINRENKHLSGVSFIGKHTTKKGLHVETNYPANLIVKNVIYLIEYCNEVPSQFRVIL